jgi:hypothetical protein
MTILVSIGISVGVGVRADSSVRAVVVMSATTNIIAVKL